MSQKKLLRSLHLWLKNGLPLGHIWLPSMFCLYLHVLGFREFLINLGLWLSLDFWMAWQHKTHSPVGWPGTGGTEGLPTFQGPAPLLFYICTTPYYLTRHLKLWLLLGERVPKLFVTPGEAFSGWTVVRSFSYIRQIKVQLLGGEARWGTCSSCPLFLSFGTQGRSPRTPWGTV